MLRKILIIVVVIFIAIQFVPVSYNTTTEITPNDFILSESPPYEIAVLLKTSCYDCHSNRTKYPWYDKVAPVSWWIQDHVDHAKEELNLSEWATYTTKKKLHKLEEIVEELEEGEMPLTSYLIMHGEAKLDKNQILGLKQWLQTIK